jgi:glutamyl-tRNA reductase
MQSDLSVLNIVAFTHRNSSLEDIGMLHLDVDSQKDRLSKIKADFNIQELMYLSTCNRIEFVISSDTEVNPSFMKRFIRSLFPEVEEEHTARLSENGTYYKDVDAISHLLEVASSVDSMIVGEREIITQVRTAFDNSREMELSGDLIRIAIRHTIETAKKVYTETNIAKRPVSVVSLAYHNLRDLNVPLDSRILLIGAGVTNTTMSRFLKKHGFTNFHVFNRTFSKAEKLAQDLNGHGHKLEELINYDGGFDVIITCTGAEQHIITPEIYRSLLGKDESKKYVVDLAIPQDLSPEITNNHNLIHISIEGLQKISNENLAARSKEVAEVQVILNEALLEFNHIHQLRSVEIAMREVPMKVKEIKENALNKVFKNELNSIDDESRVVVEQIMDYMEKKYMTVPMIMAKEILIKQKPQ